MANAKKTTTSNSNTQPLGNQTFLFDKNNYMWMIGGVILIVLGYFLMSGGKSEDPAQFDYNTIYSARRVTIAPILILIGFAIEIYAIMKKPSTK